MLTIGSLFSGIGGLELGLEWSGLGPVLWQVEQDHWCCSVLRHHWPGAVRRYDVRDCGAHNLPAVDLICGGFPCQDISSAGKGAGLAGARSGLWYEFERIVRDLRPRWVVVENVASAAQRWVDQVRLALELLDYQTLPVPLAASDCGAWHRRARVFIVAAHLDRDLLRLERQRLPGGRSRQLRARGQAESTRDGEGGGTNLDCRGCEGERGAQQGWIEGAQGDEPVGWGWFAAEPNVVRMVHGLPTQLDRDRVRALGNSVVPQCAEVIGCVVQLLAESIEP